jgi:hypothetical protein
MVNAMKMVGVDVELASTKVLKKEMEQVLAGMPKVEKFNMTTNH